MPRLRLRVASSGSTHRLELPSGCTWAGLQAEARRAVGLQPDADVVLSLNKKVPIDGSPENPLDFLGICGGDIVWMISPEVSVEAASQTSTRAPLPAQALDLMPQAAAVPSGAVGHGAGDSTAQVSEEDEGAVRQPMQQLATSGADRINGGRGGDVDGAGMNVDALAEGDAVGGISEADSGGAHPADEDEAAGTLRGLPGLRGVSINLLRLLAPLRRCASTVSSNSPSCDWFSVPPATRCLLVLDCAMAEAGFEGLQNLAVLASCGGVVPRQLLYGCRHIVTPTATNGTAADGDKVMVETAAAVSDNCRRSPSTMTPVAKLHWYGMGRFLVVHGVPYTGGSCSGGGGGWLVTQHIDLSEYGGASSALERPQEQALQPALLLPADPVGHWRFLKDGLVLPLLLGVCRGFGLAPPLGITVLPLELQMLVVGRLEARDLVVLSAVCTALHNLAVADELWKPLYDKEFGSSATAADVALANSRGYKHLYGMKWRERLERRKRRQVFRAAAPPVWGPPMMEPFVRPPFLPPGSIGGDYDRMPGPLLGGGPLSLLGSRGSFREGGTFGRGGLAGGFPNMGRRQDPWSGSWF